MKLYSNKHRLALLLLVGLAVPSLVAPLSGHTQQATGTLVYAELSDPVTLDPYLNDDSVSKRLTSLIYGSLFRVDQDLEIVNDLAIGYGTEIDPSGRTVYIMQLRTDVAWHDGVRFSSTDVVATWETVINDQTITTEKSRFLGIHSVAAVDEETVRITFSADYSAGRGNLTFPILPAHLLEDRVLDRGHKLATEPVGTGPFRFDRWVEGRFVMLSVNRDYYELGLPRLERVVMQVFANQNTMLAALESGEVHLAFDIPPEQLPRFQNNREIDVLNVFSHSYDFLGMNINRPPLDQREIREAISLALDRQGMIDRIYQGRARLLSGPFPVNSWAYNQSVPPVPYDPPRAREILDAAGVQDTNGDGIRESGSRPVLLTLLAQRGNELVLQRALSIQQYLREIGIEVEIEFVPLTYFMQRVFDDHDYDLFTTGWNIGVDPDPYSIWFSGEISDGLNAVSYFNPEVDDLILQARQTAGRERRQLIYRRIHELIAADHPYAFLWTRERNIGINRSFEGFTVDVFDLSRGLVSTEMKSGR